MTAVSNVFNFETQGIANIGLNDHILYSINFNIVAPYVGLYST